MGTVVVECPGCGTRNRVLVDRADEAVCGRKDCAEPLEEAVLEAEEEGEEEDEEEIPF